MINQTDAPVKLSDVNDDMLKKDNIANNENIDNEPLSDGELYHHKSLLRQHTAVALETEDTRSESAVLSRVAIDNAAYLPIAGFHYKTNNRKRSISMFKHNIHNHKTLGYSTAVNPKFISFDNQPQRMPNFSCPIPQRSNQYPNQNEWPSVLYLPQNQCENKLDQGTDLETQKRVSFSQNSYHNSNSNNSNNNNIHSISSPTNSKQINVNITEIGDNHIQLTIPNNNTEITSHDHDDLFENRESIETHEISNVLQSSDKCKSKCVTYQYTKENVHYNIEQWIQIAKYVAPLWIVNLTLMILAIIFWNQIDVWIQVSISVLMIVWILIASHSTKLLCFGDTPNIFQCTSAAATVQFKIKHNGSNIELKIIQPTKPPTTKRLCNVMNFIEAAVVTIPTPQHDVNNNMKVQKISEENTGNMKNDTDDGAGLNENSNESDPLASYESVSCFSVFQSNPKQKIAFRYKNYRSKHINQYIIRIGNKQFVDTINKEIKLCQDSMLSQYNCNNQFNS